VAESQTVESCQLHLTKKMLANQNFILHILWWFVAVIEERNRKILFVVWLLFFFFEERNYHVCDSVNAFGKNDNL